MARCVGITVGLLICVALLGCGDDPAGSSGSSKGASTGRFVLDGTRDPDVGEPVLAESGIVGRGRFGNGIDIKEVYVANDEEVLYVYLRTEPSVAHRYQEEKSTGALCELYVDTDNDPATGCKDYDLFGYGLISGFDRKSDIPLGVSFGFRAGEGAYENYFIGYAIQQPTAEGAWEDLPGTGGPSGGETPKNVKDSDHGVEFVVSLAHLEVGPGQTVRILLKERADGFERDSCNEFVYELR